MTKKRLFILVPALLLAVVLGVGAWWFLTGSAPEEANLGDLAEATGAAGTDGATATESDASDLSGSWVVAQGESVFVGYRIDEVLANVGDFTVVGRTPEVEGTMEAEGLTITEVTITADVTQLKSDKLRRDGALKTQALESNTFPTAVFVLTEPIIVASIPPEGEAVTVEALGELTAHGVTQSVTMNLETGIVGRTVLVAGQIDILLSDFGIAAPSAPIVVSVADEAVVEFSLLFERT